MDKRIELEASEALLDIGVSVPLKSFRIPFTKRRLSLRLTMKRPCLWNMIRIANIYLQIGVTHEEMKSYTKEEEMAFIALHGNRISQMVALAICRDGILAQVMYKPLAWFLRRSVSDVYLQGAFMCFISLMGTRAFMGIINSVERVNPMTPKLSQKRKGS